MHIHFDPDFDGGALVGEEDRASFGRAVVGPRGFLEILETALGLGGQYPSELERVVALLPRVQGEAGFWQVSATNDPIGTAERLLQWRDTLVSWGWDGRARAGRLGALWDVSAKVPGGHVDRAAAVVGALGANASPKARIESVTLYAPKDAAGPLYHRILDALAAQGTAVTAPAPAPPPTGETNLRRMQRALLDQTAFRIAPHDTSLQLLRPYGWGQAAEAVGALLAPHYARDGDVATTTRVAIIGADVTLDDALARHGVPTTGRAQPGRGVQAGNAVLHVVPLLCELATGDADPQRALDLLSLPESPIPRNFRRPLMRALADAPSTRSAAWNKALSKQLDKTTDANKRNTRATLLGDLLTPPLTAGGALAAHVDVMLDHVERWARDTLRVIRGRSASHHIPDAPDDDRSEESDWHAVLTQCRSLRRILGALHTAAGQKIITKPRLRQALALSMPVSTRSSYRDQAGTLPLVAPGGLAARTPAVIWWNFTRQNAGRVGDVPLHAEERAALQQMGATLFDGARRAELQKLRERRALLNASDKLVLVCPQRGSDGEALHPHALWDEVLARIDDHGAPASVLQCELPRTDTPRPRPVRKKRSLIKPERTLTLAPGTVPEREQESPSSLVSYLGCDLKHVLEYGAGLRSGAEFRVELSDRALGTAAHALLEALGKAGAFERDAGAEAAAYFDEHIGAYLAQLNDPAREDERTSLRDAVISAAACMGRLVQDEGFSVHLIEETVAGLVDGIQVGGKPDIILRDKNGRLVVVDFKLGNASGRTQDLKKGTALQLAAYAKILEKKSHGPVSIAYYIIRAGQLLIIDDDVAAEGIALPGPRPDEVWESVRHAVVERKKARAQGTVLAQGLGGKDVIVKNDKLQSAELGGFVAKAPCYFCEYKTICGLAFEDDAIEGDAGGAS